MKRDCRRLHTGDFDLLVIGGGIHGAAAVWRLAVAGYRVALVEKDDFCQATSANSLKILHGGLRYLQHADFQRMRESIRARREFMALAPHLTADRYVNYLGDDEPGDPIAGAYGNNFKRLQQVKREYDPTNFFHMNQNVKPA